MKGTPSMGKRSSGKTHIRCRRCGSHSYHVRKKFCASCHFGRSACMRTYAWLKKNWTKGYRHE